MAQKSKQTDQTRSQPADRSPTDPSWEPDDAVGSSIAEQLVSGGLDLIRSEGTGELSARRLAAAGGRSTMCLYSKFRSRQGLINALYAEAASALLATLDADDDPAATYTDYARSEPRLYVFLFGADLSALGLEPEARRDLIRQCSRRLAHDGSDGIDNWGRLHGAICAELAGAS